MHHRLWQKLPAFNGMAASLGLDSLDGSTSAVTLMTIHAAKGLEFLQFLLLVWRRNLPSMQEL